MSSRKRTSNLADSLTTTVPTESDSSTAPVQTEPVHDIADELGHSNSDDGTLFLCYLQIPKCIFNAIRSRGISSSKIC